MPEIGLFGSEGGAPTHGVPTLSAIFAYRTRKLCRAETVSPRGRASKRSGTTKCQDRSWHREFYIEPPVAEVGWMENEANEAGFELDAKSEVVKIVTSEDRTVADPLYTQVKLIVERRRLPSDLDQSCTRPAELSIFSFSSFSSWSLTSLLMISIR